MDTSEQVAIETSSHTKRRRRTVEEKRRIVEETLEAGASVARVARRHAVNATRSSTGAKSIVKEDWVRVGPALSSL